MKDIRQQWKAHAASKKITSQDIAALCIYRSLVKEQGEEGALSRLKKSFTPVTNPVKLANGASPMFSMRQALWMVKNSVFTEWLTDEEYKPIGEIALSLHRSIK
jgi:hypothetical protein